MKIGPSTSLHNSRASSHKQRDVDVPYCVTSLGKFRVIKSNSKTKSPSRIELKVGWSDGSFTWEPFDNIKEDDPVSLAGYAMRVFKTPAYSGYKKNKALIDKAQQWGSTFLSTNANLNPITSSANANIKFGVTVPKGIRGATKEDAIYDNDKLLSASVQYQRWATAMTSEQNNFDEHNAFKFLPKGTPAPAGYQRMRCHFVYDVKSDGKFKARFCAGGDSVDSTGVNSAMTVVETPSTRILFVIAEANGQEVLVGDLSSAYLHAYTKEKVYFVCGPEWGPQREGCVAVVVKAVYGLVGSAHAYHQHIFETNCSEMNKLPQMEQGLRDDMMKKYPEAMEEKSTRTPEILGEALNLTVYADADHAHDQVTRRSITGIIVFIGSTPIIAKSTRQGSVESSTYSAEFNSARAATELIIGLRLLLRSLGVSQDKPIMLLGDNLGVVQSSTMFTSALKKKHNAISYHRVREAVATGIIDYTHIDTALNLADIFTKPLDSVSVGKLRDSFLRSVSVVDCWITNANVSE
jgi:hypothetical protein